MARTATLNISVFVNTLKVLPEQHNVPAQGGTFTSTVRMDSFDPLNVVTPTNSADFFKLTYYDEATKELTAEVAPNKTNEGISRELILTNRNNPSQQSNVIYNQEPGEIKITNKANLAGLQFRDTGTTTFRLEIAHTYPEVTVICKTTDLQYTVTRIDHEKSVKSIFEVTVTPNPDKALQPVFEAYFYDNFKALDKRNSPSDSFSFSLPKRKGDVLEGVVQLIPKLIGSNGFEVGASAVVNSPAVEMKSTPASASFQYDQTFDPPHYTAKELIITDTAGNNLAPLLFNALQISSSSPSIISFLKVAPNKIRLWYNNAPENDMAVNITVKCVDVESKFPYLSPTELLIRPSFTAQFSDGSTSELEVEFGVGTSVAQSSDSKLGTKNFDNDKILVRKFDGTSQDLSRYNWQAASASDIAEATGSDGNTARYFRAYNGIRIPFTVTGIPNNSNKEIRFIKMNLSEVSLDVKGDVIYQANPTDPRERLTLQSVTCENPTVDVEDQPSNFFDDNGSLKASWDIFNKPILPVGGNLMSPKESNKFIGGVYTLGFKRP